MAITNTPPPARRWTLFKGGFVAEHNNFVELVPFEDEYLRIFFFSDDVRSGGTEVFIREGSRYVELQVRPGSRYFKRRVGEKDQDCPLGSECIGGNRFCCDTWGDTMPEEANVSTIDFHTLPSR
jgi:hypothetical protein